MMFEFADEVERLTDIRVAGVGGGGGNAIGRMIEAGLVGVEFMALNTDLQALNDCKAHHCMQIGSILTSGLGSGGNPDVGQAAAEEDRETIAKAIGGANMVFVTGGMGGGTGTGAAPIVAEVARESGALTVGIVTKPFLFEGQVRMRQAEEGIARLREAVDTLIVVPNQRLLEIVPPNTSMQEAYRIADNVLYEATRGIFEIISRHDHMNLDFADVCAVMRGMGEAMMGTGRADGQDRAIKAAEEAISSPLLEDVNIAGSQAVLVNVLGREVQLHETAAAMQFIQEAAGPQAHVIFGYGVDESLDDTLQVTVIATGFQVGESSRPTRPAAKIEAVAPEPQTEPQPEPHIEPEQAQDLTEPEIIPEPEADVSGIAEARPDIRPELDFGNSAAEVGSQFQAEPVPEPDPEPEPEPESQPDPEPEHMRQPAATVQPENAIPRENFLKREAAAGGPDQPQASSSVVSSFLKPLGVRNIGEVEVPGSEDEPARVSRSEAAGLGPDNPGDDRKTPAYIRKYMD